MGILEKRKQAMLYGMQRSKDLEEQLIKDCDPIIDKINELISDKDVVDKRIYSMHLMLSIVLDDGVFLNRKEKKGALKTIIKSL